MGSCSPVGRTELYAFRGVIYHTSPAGHRGVCSGLGPLLLSVVFLKPRSSPTAPPGLGTGHSLFALATRNPSSSLLLPKSTMFPSGVSVTSGLLLLLRLPSGGISPSAYLTRGAGHGSMWGSPTTKKLAKTVAAKSDEVMRDLGCRCGGGMMEDSQRRRTFLYLQLEVSHRVLRCK